MQLQHGWCPLVHVLLVMHPVGVQGLSDCSRTAPGCCEFAR